MTEKQKSKTKTRNKDLEIKPVRKGIAWSRGTPTIVIPATMRDALGLKLRARIEVEVSLIGDRSGILIRVLAPSS